MCRLEPGNLIRKLPYFFGYADLIEIWKSGRSKKQKLTEGEKITGCWLSPILQPIFLPHLTPTPLCSRT